jgi:mono/diheme cytochrome c family protein
MLRLRWFGLGIAAALASVLLAGAIAIRSAQGFSAREQPSGIELWIARRARSAAVPIAAKDRVNPVPNTPEVLADARAHWADHCATCHGNDGSGDTQLGKRTYPRAPDMRLEQTQQMTDGELFYIIENGIRLTAMPGWGNGSAHDEQDSWQLVRFIRHLPGLTLEEKKAMEKLNPKSPEELKEEEEEEKFLKGEPANEPQTEHHRHH